MIDSKKVLAIIPARGGSKGVPRKNLRHVGGKPLIGWAIEASHASKYIDRTIISSEDSEILEVARSYGCEVPFIRPAELSQDDTPGMAPILHAIDQLPGYDLVVVLQPTSPLRSTEEIDAAIALCISKNAASCVSVTYADKHPLWMYQMTEDHLIHPIIAGQSMITRRQDLPDAYILNGAVYVATTNHLLLHKNFLTEDTIGFVMPKESSIDVDTELDLFIVDSIIKRNVLKY